MFTNDTVLIAEDKSGLQKILNVFGAVCRRNLSVNVRKSKVMEFEQDKSVLIKFFCPCRVKVER